jgi:hypothetical protein
MNRTQLVSASIGFLVGLGVAWSAFSVLKKNDASVEAEKSWLVCTRVNMSIISDAVATYVRSNTRPGSIDLETLVRAKLVPEWSEIYICPAQYGIAPVRSAYDESFRSNIFKPSPIAANYANCSYSIETLSESFRVRCRYHTNVLDFTIPNETSSDAMR